MLVVNDNNSLLLFRDKPVNNIPTFLLTNKITADITFPEVLILEVVVFPYQDPTLFERATAGTTLRRGEGWVHVEDLAVGETVRCWLKSRHYLVPYVIRSEEHTSELQSLS